MARVSIVLVVVSVVVVVRNLGVSEVADVAQRSLQREGATQKAEEERQRESSRGGGATRVAEVTQKSCFNFFVTSSRLSKAMTMLMKMRVLCPSNSTIDGEGQVSTNTDFDEQDIKERKWVVGK